MRLKLFAGTALALAMSSNVYAAPKVAVDIAPLHSLVSQVMQDVGEPNLIIPAGASPHYYSLRPSEAKALAGADVVFWVGEGLTPWLEKALDNVSSSAEKVEVTTLDGTTTYPYREGATFESHDHHDEHGDDHDDDKNEHSEEAHDDHHDDHKDKHSEEAHDDHQDEHDDHKDEHHDGHHDEHEGNDPHVWLDPVNAKVWLTHIQAVLTKHDPDNAAAYRRNAEKAGTALDALIDSTRTQIEALNQPKFIVFHDAYQYFEKRFDISAAGSISLGDAEDPSPARVREIQETVKQLGVSCVFTEPQYNASLVKNVFEGSTVSTIGVMDPLGADLVIGAGHYPALIQGMVNSLSECR